MSIITPSGHVPFISVCVLLSLSFTFSPSVKEEKHSTAIVHQLILMYVALWWSQLVTVHQWALSCPAGVLYGVNKEC